MATDTILPSTLSDHESAEFSVWTGFKRVLEPVSSLKLTVVLFALSIFLILAGTFAQVDKDIWEVIGLYFRCWMAWVPFQVFFPPSFFPEKPVVVPGGIWFPGGKLLGLLLAINLVSAHLVRFRVAAKGQRIVLGAVAIALGCAVTWAIIAAGGNSKGIQGDPWIPYRTQWIGYQGLLGLSALVSAFGLITLCQQPLSQTSEKWRRQLFLRSVVAVTGFLLTAVLTWIVLRGEAGRPADASLRILWQLTQGAVASIALLGGCWAVFGGRAGIVLLHGGIGLMMFYELHVALTAVETQMNITEGEQVNFVHDIRTCELAIVDVTDPKEDRVVAIPRSYVTSETPIDRPELPFNVKVTQFLKNSHLRPVTSDDKNLATQGIGRTWFPEERKPGSGTDNDSKIDMPAAYVTLVSKTDGATLGTFLVGLELSLANQSDTTQIGDKSYRIDLRPKRYYKPYRFELKDVRKEDYIGTNTPRNYASTVHIVDSTRNVDEEKTIWMNNPLRFADETFYQSNYHQEAGTGIEHTTLSVVANSGWMMPYVGCMLVGVGMLCHFLIVLVRFLTKGDTIDVSAADAERAANLAARMGIKPKASTVPAVPASAALSDNRWLSFGFAVVMMVCAAGYLVRTSTPPKARNLSFDFYKFGQIPVVSEGRAKPLDSAAVSALLAISGRTQLTVGEGNSQQKVPAVQWLMEVIADTKVSDEREIFRVENLELQETLGVRKREGMRYSRNEVQGRSQEFKKQYEDARKQAASDAKQLSVFKKKVLELSEKFSTFGNLKAAFGLQNRIGGKTNEEVLQSFQEVMQISEELEEMGQPVFAVGPVTEDEKWHTMSRAWVLDLVNRIQKNGTGNKTVAAWDQILKSFSEDKPVAFNKAVDDLLSEVEAHPPRRQAVGDSTRIIPQLCSAIHAHLPVVFDRVYPRRIRLAVLAARI